MEYSNISISVEILSHIKPNRHVGSPQVFQAVEHLNNKENNNGIICHYFNISFIVLLSI
jgi:hypothetical protein